MSTTGKITTGPDSESETIMFASQDTPADAYMALTDAVVGAKFHDGWTQVDTEQIPRHTVVGTATYEDGEVTALELNEGILEEYGHSA